MSIPGRPSLQERSIGARRLDMIKLTETREITPYLWVHPDEERWARLLTPGGLFSAVSQPTSSAKVHDRRVAIQSQAPSS